jgi:hypothetical protein
MDEDFKKELMSALNRAEKASRKAYERGKGKRGSNNNPTCNFYMGSYASFEAVIKDIKNGNTTELESWIKGA